MLIIVMLFFGLDLSIFDHFAPRPQFNSIARMDPKLPSSCYIMCPGHHHVLKQVFSKNILVLSPFPC